MIWLAFRPGDRVLGELDAMDHAAAGRLAALRWGEAVERVQSRASWEIALQERAIPPRRRVRPEEDDDDGA